MKTITKTLALLFVAAAFTACTNQSIEPERPTQQLRTDTTHSLIQNSTEGKPARQHLHGKMIIAEDVDPGTTQPGSGIEPTPYPVSVPAPRPAVMPVEQLNGLIN